MKTPKVRPDKSGNCELCGTWRKVLCRDRIIPGREGGIYESGNIQMICANCHQDKTALEQSAAHKGRPKSAEQRAKMSAWQIGKQVSQVTRDRISAAVTASMADPELREHLSAKAKERAARTGGPWKGKKHSPETKAKIADALRARVTHCPKGHVYDEANTIIGKNGKRNCRTCRSEKKKLAYASETPEQKARRLDLKRQSYHRHGDSNRAKMNARYAGSSVTAMKA